MQFVDRNIRAAGAIARKRKVRGGAGGLAHDEAAAADARGRLALMRHRGAAPGHQQVVEAGRHQHAIGQVVEAARAGNVGPAPDHVARHMVFDRPAVDADGVGKARAGKHVIGGELVMADDPAGLADAELRRDVDDIGIGEARRLAAQEFEERQRLAPAFDFARRSVRRHRFRRRRGRCAFLTCVTFTRHSLECFCGRTIAPLRGKITPRFSAASISAGIVRQASPAAAGSTPFTRNIMVG